MGCGINSVADITRRVNVCLFSTCFQWACTQDFWLLKANLGPLGMPNPGMGPLVLRPFRKTAR